MCGRFTQTASPAVIAQQFHVAVPPLFTSRYNIAASRIHRNGRGSRNYAEPTVGSTPNYIGQNHEASSI
jgi:putative SOS response-associated peptidase YedK